MIDNNNKLNRDEDISHILCFNDSNGVGNET